MLFNNNDYIDDDDLFDEDDFEVDFDDDLGYDSGKSSRPKKEEKKEVKEVKKTPKKEIKVETKKSKKTESKVEEKEEVKKETKKSSSPSKEKKKDETKTVKKASKKTTDSKKKPTKKKKRKTKKIVIKLPVSDEEGLSKEDLEEAIKAALKDEISEPEVEETKTEEVETEEESKTEEVFDVQEETREEIEPIEEEEEDFEENFLVKFKRSLRKLKRYRRQIYISLGVLVVLLIGFIVVNSMSISISFGKKNNSSINQESDVTLDDYHKTWQSYEDINSDYVGQIVFSSGLINKPFVQATSCYKENGVPYKFYNQDGSIVSDFSEKTGNDVYIWMDFETMKYDYDKKGGSIFMDYRNTLSDQNLIIYGHFFSTIYNKDPDRVKSFTPLEKLLEEENYQDNRLVEIVLENEVRVYDLYAVYKFNSDDDEYWEKGQYFRPNYNIDDFTDEKDSNYMKNYIEFIKEVRLYDTDIELEPGDDTLTLQTCMTPYTNLYEICVFKLVDTYIY